MKILIAGLAIFLVLATLLSMVRSDQWWVRACDFPRLQIAALMVLVLPAIPLLYGWPDGGEGLLLIALFAALAQQVRRILPYTRLTAPEVASDRGGAPGSRLRLLIANVLMDNRRADAFLALVREYDPDMILTLETDGWWERQLAVLEADYPYGVRHALDTTYGLHLYSRLELDQPQLRFLIEEGVPSVYARLRLSGGRWIDFYGIHPSPPRPGQDTEERDAELLVVAREVKSRGRPAVVAGDLNDVAWSHTTRLFRRISGLLDPRIGRGFYSTYNAKWPLFRWPLDHIFHDRGFTLVRLQRLRYFGSDQFPVLAELCYRPEAASSQPPEPADGDDLEEARQKIANGLAAANESR